MAGPGTAAGLRVRDATAAILERDRLNAARPYGGATPMGYQLGAQYGALLAPPRGDLDALRQQQADFHETIRDLDGQNSWMAIPPFAAVAAALGLEALAANAARGALFPGGPLAFVEREAWQRGPRRVGSALPRKARGALRDQARDKVERVNNVRAPQLGADVHHSDPLEWAHLKPDADPNRLANLWPLPREIHDMATREWAAFSRSLNGRLPTQAELMAMKLRIDRLVAPYIRRPGASWSVPKKPGPNP